MLPKRKKAARSKNLAASNKLSTLAPYPKGKASKSSGASTRQV